MDISSVTLYQNFPNSSAVLNKGPPEFKTDKKKL